MSIGVPVNDDFVADLCDAIGWHKAAETMRAFDDPEEFAGCDHAVALAEIATASAVAPKATAKQMRALLSSIYILAVEAQSA